VNYSSLVNVLHYIHRDLLTNYLFIIVLDIFGALQLQSNYLFIIKLQSNYLYIIVLDMSSALLMLFMAIYF